MTTKALNTLYKDLLPPLSTDEFKALRASIKRDGVREPIVVDEAGNILDGHHRYRIDKNAPRRIIKGLSEPEKKAFVYRANNERRNLSPTQKTAIQKSMKAVALELNAAKYKQADIAALLGVARQRVSDWLRNGKNISNAGNGKTYTLYHDSRVKIPRKAYETIFKRSQANESQKQIAADYGVTQPQISGIVARENKRQKQREHEAQLLASISDSPLWLLTSNQEVVACNVLMTDPPYGILDESWEPDKIETFTRDWANRWNECGADLFLVFWSQRYLFDGRAWFDDALSNYQFQQLLIWHYPNNKSPQGRQMFKQTYEPIFMYRKNGSTQKIEVGEGEWGDGLNDFDCHVAAVPQSNFNGADMKEHPAQKPLSVMRWLVNATTRRGELVCDPFSGGGTTGIAAVQLERRFHGIEINPDYLDLAKRRLAAYGSQR